MSEMRITIDDNRLSDDNFLITLNALTHTHVFDEDVLEKYHMRFDMRTLIKDQKLSLDFIFKHILENEDLSSEEQYIDDGDIVRYQKYTYEQISDYRNSYNK